jgi:hypothetical protein
MARKKRPGNVKRIAGFKPGGGVTRISRDKPKPSEVRKTQTRQAGTLPIGPSLKRAGWKVSDRDKSLVKDPAREKRERESNLKTGAVLDPTKEGGMRARVGPQEFNLTPEEYEFSRTGIGIETENVRAYMAERAAMDRLQREGGELRGAIESQFAAGKSAAEIVAMMEGGELLTAEQQAAQEAITPIEHRELSQKREGFEAVPIIGPVAGITADLIRYGLHKTLPEDSPVRNLLDNISKGSRQSLATNDISDPDVLNNILKQEIENKVREEGLTLSESMGGLFEIIPGVQFVVETPAGDVQQARRQLKQIQRRMTKLAESAGRKGGIPTEMALQQLQEDRERIYKTQSRIALLSEASSDLWFNDDMMNTIEEEMYNAEFYAQDVEVRIRLGPNAPPASPAMQAYEISLEEDFEE